MKRYDEAFEVAMRAREISFNERTQRILGLVYLRRGDDERAIFHLSKADADAAVATALIEATINANKLDDLDTVIEKAAKVKDSTPALKRAAEEAKALLARRKELNKLVTIPKDKASEYAAALDALAGAEEARRRGKPFEALLAKAFGKDVEVGPAYGLRARAELGRGRLGKALADAEKALELSPKDANGFYVRGKVRDERGKAKEGLADLLEAAELTNKGDADVMFALSEALARAGKKEAAIESAKVALALRPKDAEIEAHLAELQKKR
jgi:tetratricopeptide (TPR) repeat protein